MHDDGPVAVRGLASLRMGWGDEDDDLFLERIEADARARMARGRHG
ncbi:hypothetical protein KIN34_03130 [Cellulomonas sp. DKR-3]|uniref:Uncharacterized protein n=1 Tax=Cellulomonas fulva TaxID=2835530 RepID=A0ABS5TVW2_9CELL|nr:hypothetical protein [Cellulomonas fulva]MBT0993280.1 hypothetical protein [Cellulomonas fulva]